MITPAASKHMGLMYIVKGPKRCVLTANLMLQPRTGRIFGMTRLKSWKITGGMSHRDRANRTKPPVCGEDQYILQPTMQGKRSERWPDLIGVFPWSTLTIAQNGGHGLARRNYLPTAIWLQIDLQCDRPIECGRQRNHFDATLRGSLSPPSQPSTNWLRSLFIDRDKEKSNRKHWGSLSTINSLQLCWRAAYRKRARKAIIKV